jgi:hypothetical protein
LLDHAQYFLCFGEVLSVFGRLFDKYRGNLQLKRGVKIAYLSVNDRIQKGLLDTSKEEALFNDSDIEEVFEDREVEVVEPVGSLEAMLAGSVQDEAAG